MNRDEELALKCLQSMGFQSVIYEPDGNIPPDFLVDNRIAVEVRRLNQNSVNDVGKSKGLEEESIPLWQKFENLLESFGPPVNGKSWFIGIHFERPLPSWVSLLPQIKLLLEKLKIVQPTQLVNYKLTDGFEINVIPSTQPLKTIFSMGMSSDGDSGGFVLGEMDKNLRLIVPEKYKKIEKYKAKYKEWWLVLPNYIHYRMNEYDIEQFNTYIKFQHNWDRVVMFNPLNVSNWMEF